MRHDIQPLLFEDKSDPSSQILLLHKSKNDYTYDGHFVFPYLISIIIVVGKLLEGTESDILA